MALLFSPYLRATDQVNAPIPGAFLSFYATQTSTLQAIWADVNLTVPLSNPIQSDGNGVYPVIWLDDSLPAYKVVQQYPDINDPSVPGAIVSGPYGTVDPYNALVSAQQLGGLVNPVTSAETSLSVKPTNLLYVEGDIRRYGATKQSDGTSQTTNNTAIQTALNVSGAGGKPAYIPSGIWAYSASPVAPTGSSMFGDGQNSILNPNGCDGLQFAAAGNIEKSRFFRDFKIIGSATASTRDGIVINFSAASGDLVSGLVFENLSIENFFYGVFSRGLWQSAFRECFLYNNYNGYYFHGQSVVVRVEGGFIQKGSLAGSGTQVGITVDSVAGETCQSLHLIEVPVYGYDVNVSMGPCLYTVLENCDLSVASQVGIQVAASSAGLIIRDCWIQTHSGSFATIGINLADLGTAIQDKVVIDGCTVVCDLANAGSQGIYVGTNQQSATITNCTIGSVTSPFASGVVSNGLSHNLKVEKNTIYASSAAITISSNATDVSVHDNTIQNGSPLLFSGLTPVRLSYRAAGTFTMTLTGMTGTVTGTVNWLANGRQITLSVPSAGITGTSNATTMTGTGLPQYLWPVTAQIAQFRTLDNTSTTTFGMGSIASASGIITFSKDANATAFTASGTKGLNGMCSTYAYA